MPDDKKRRYLQRKLRFSGLKIPFSIVWIVEGPQYANMDGCAARVSNAEVPRYANMDGGVASVTNVAGSSICEY